MTTVKPFALGTSGSGNDGSWHAVWMPLRGVYAYQGWAQAVCAGNTTVSVEHTTDNSGKLTPLLVDDINEPDCLRCRRKLGLDRGLAGIVKDNKRETP